MKNIFSGIRVLELSSVLAGPSVGMFFAELGAEVIKIENPEIGGDVTRSWKTSEEKSDSDISSYFCAVNFGKKSIALNLKKKEDYIIFNKLVSVSDIITVSFKNGDDLKLKADYKSIKKINPKIIYAQITGFGLDDERTAFDAVIQAYSGFMSINGYPEKEPLKMPVALIDILTAHQIKEAILLAYINKLKTGNGSYVHCSLLDAGISSLANQATNYLNTGVVPHRKGSEHPNIYPYGSLFKTADDKFILLAIGSDSQFKKFCLIVDKDKILSSEKYNKNADRVKLKDELKPIIEKYILSWKSKNLIKALDKYKIPAAIVLDLKEVFKQKQTDKLVLKSKIKKENYIGVRTFSADIKNNKQINLRPPPHLDQHRKEILKLI